MPCPSYKIDSNITGFSFAEEECLKQLPSGTPALYAEAVLTFGDVGTDEDTVTIGSKTYTLVDTLSGADDVLIGASPAETAANLLAAVLDLGTGYEGVVYGSGTTVNAAISASLSTRVGSVLTLVAATAGAAGNSLASTETSTSCFFTDTTFGGGADAAGVTPTWYNLEPNSYDDLGGELTTVARAPIDPNRQNKKGTPTDLDASGGFNIDHTQHNLDRLMQGVFVADVREKPTTMPTNDDAIVLTGVTTASDHYEATGIDLSAFNLAGLLVWAAGFSNAANNGLKTVVSATTGYVAVSQNLADETPPADARLDAVGYQFGADALSIVMSGNLCRLTGTAMNTLAASLGVIPGEWIFVGGDSTSTRFANNQGYARIKTITSTYWQFDDVTWSPVNETTTGSKTVQIFLGKVNKNEQAADIVTRSYQFERTLGNGPTDVQAEYLEGSYVNEFTLNVPQADKLNVDITLVACDNRQRSGEVGDERKAGNHVGALGEDAFNTSSDIYRSKLSLHDASTSNPDALFAFLTEATLTINNNVSPVKAIGTLGAIDVALGNFEVGGSITALFTTVEAQRAVRNNADAGISYIFAKSNHGFIYDVPLLALGGGRLNVEKDNPITLPIESSGAENELGYTAMHVNFRYLPTLAMPA